MTSNSSTTDDVAPQKRGFVVDGKTVDLSKLKEDASGKWHHIFSALAKDSLHAALAYAPDHVACPGHGGTDGYRLFEHYNTTGRSVCNTCGVQRSGLDTLMLANGWSLTKAVEEVMRWLGDDSAMAAVVALPPPVLKPRVPPEVAFRRLSEVWRASTPIANTAAERYLVNRGIWQENLSESLRAHPGLAYVHGKERTFYGKFPCLLAPIRNAKRALVSIHRIYVTPEGLKAPVPDAKKMMSQHLELAGSAIQLFPAGETLGLAEGIETALAAHAISRMPVWATVTAGLMEQVEIPAHVKRVVIWADLDVSERGIIAASKLADRLEKQGVIVEVYLPQGKIPEGTKGVDWLDVMLTQGLNGFPAKWRRWRPTTALAA